MPVLLNPRHEHFAQLVAGGLSPTDAYRKVGYSENGAHASAHRLLQIATVAARLEELRAAVTERTLEKAAVDRAWIIERLKSNVERARQAEPVLDRDGKETGQFRFDAAGANRALELLGRSIGLFVDRSEHSGPNGGPIPVQPQPAYDFSKLTQEEFDQLNALSEKALREPENNENTASK